MVCGENLKPIQHNDGRFLCSFLCSKNPDEHEYKLYLSDDLKLISYYIKIICGKCAIYIYVGVDDNNTVMSIYDWYTYQYLFPLKKLDYAISSEEVTKYIYELKRIIKNRAFI